MGCQIRMLTFFLTMRDTTIYFDNATTSWPKPPCVEEAMTHFLRELGASPGRSGYRLSIEAGRIVYAAREALADLFHAPDPLRVLFAPNITEALNLALFGLLRSGDHVIASSMEHHSIIRPLRVLEQRGVDVSVVPGDAAGRISPADVQAAIRANTVMIALNHASNVVGTIQPVREIGAIARQRGLLLLVDTAQTAGVLPLDMAQDQIDLLGFTGHKALYGPTGTGGLILGERVDLARLEPLKRGGTGSVSESEAQPDFLPDKYESGTLNSVGLAGLLASVQWLNAQSLAQIRAHEMRLTQQLINELTAIPGVTVYGTQDAAQQTATVSFNIKGMQPSAVGQRLDEEFGICCRVGLHCAPGAHRTIGTFPVGTVRFGLGAFNTPEEIASAAQAVATLTRM